jgi:hypothetical protein
MYLHKNILRHSEIQIKLMRYPVDKDYSYEFKKNLAIISNFNTWK